MIKVSLKIVLVILFSLECIGCQHSGAQQNEPWSLMEEIINNIIPTTFKDQDLNNTDYGAVPDGVTDCTTAIKKAIEACHQAGGGRVVVFAGNYYTGPIYLKSHVNLHLQKDATLLFSTKPEDYLPLVKTRWEGSGCHELHPSYLCHEQREHRHYRPGSAGRSGSQ